MLFSVDDSSLSLSSIISSLFCFSSRLTRGLKEIFVYPAGMNIKPFEIDSLVIEVWTQSNYAQGKQELCDKLKMHLVHSTSSAYFNSLSQFDNSHIAKAG